MMNEVFKREHKLNGTCNLVAAGEIFADLRCWIDFRATCFLVELNKTITAKVQELDDAEFIFRRLCFQTRHGPLRSDRLDISFVKHRPSYGGWSRQDSVTGELLDLTDLRHVWKFVCNAPLMFKTAIDGSQVIYLPGTNKFDSILLEEDLQIQGTEYGLVLTGTGKLSSAQHQALDLALGCPTRFFAGAQDCQLTLHLNDANHDGKFRFLFHCAGPNGYQDFDLTQKSIAEVYRAALVFQSKQPDGGEEFCYAVAAFMEARSNSLGYVTKLLTAMHFLEWLDGARTLNKNPLVDLGLPLALGEALVALRNAIAHNNRHLHRAVMQCCDSFEAFGINLSGSGDGDRRDYDLLAFIFSFVGKVLLEKMGAEVVPVNYKRDVEPFTLEDGLK